MEVTSQTTPTAAGSTPARPAADDSATKYPGLAVAREEIQKYFLTSKPEALNRSLLIEKSSSDLYSYPQLRTMLEHLVLRSINPIHLDAALNDIRKLTRADDFMDILAHAAHRLFEHTTTFLNNHAMHRREDYMPSHFPQKFAILRKFGLASASTYHNHGEGRKLNPVTEFRDRNAHRANDTRIAPVYEVF
jgi:hypothetical protein